MCKSKTEEETQSSKDRRVEKEICVSGPLGLAFTEDKVPRQHHREV